MNYRVIAWAILAGYCILGSASSSLGQVWLEAPILEISRDDHRDDRYGGYEPVDFDEPMLRTAQNGPDLFTRTDEKVPFHIQGVTPLAPPPSDLKASPLPTPAPQSTSNSAPVPSSGTFAPPTSTLSTPAPYGLSAPPMTIYDYGVPVSPMPRRACSPWRPCGPDESFGGNWLFKQGFHGADFRPACASHDDCLMSGCMSRKDCDRIFLLQLDNACRYSQFPILCRLKARQYYLGVRLFGWLY